MAFKVDVPIDKQGNSSNSGNSTSGGKDSGETKKLNTEIAGLTKAIAIGNVIAGSLSGVTEGLSQLIQPLIRVLSALFIVIFLPLLPMLVKLTDAVADFTTKVADAGGGFGGLVDAVMGEFDAEFTGLAAILVGITIAAFGSAAVGWPLIIGGALAFFAKDIAAYLVDAIGSWWTIILTTVVAGVAIVILAATTGWIIAILAILAGIFIA